MMPDFSFLIERGNFAIFRYDLPPEIRPPTFLTEWTILV